jgi:hypothetical protein
MRAPRGELTLPHLKRLGFLTMLKAGGYWHMDPVRDLSQNRCLAKNHCG